jgi:DNA-binding MarR family transcriptional regulator
VSVGAEGKVLLGLSHVQTRLHKRQDQWLAAHGISFKEFQVMSALSEASTHSLKRIDLAEKVGLSASGVTRMLLPMEKIGLISKEEGARDARVSLVRLSAAGERILADAEKSFTQGARAFMKSLSEEQRAALATLSRVVLP